ncbi:MAG: protein kinase [Thermomicrobiales bacterium]
MPAAKDYYTMLGVHPKASDEVIKAAYRALVKKYQGDNDRLQKLNEANSVLTKRRAEYDEGRAKPPGKVIGEYRILKKIAEGGFGTTYQAENIVLGTPVCIKHALNISPEDETLLLDEARTIWDLRHWGIPAMRDVLRMPDGSLALVMSYIPGPTLAELIIDKYQSGLEPEHVAWITERILNILMYLHMHGVLHLDVKPQNVIIQPDTHTVSLVDYGLSAFKPKKTTEAKGYTPYFAAPEQLDGGVMLPQTDLYGLGMTMIFALGGDVEHVKVPSTTPANMVKFLKKLIRRDAIQRPNVWKEHNLCEEIKEVRQADFGRTASSMKPLTF